MSQISLLGGALSIGEKLDGKNDAVGNPRFVISYNAAPPEALIDIRGAFSIRTLGTHGMVNVRLAKDWCWFKSKLAIFHGALTTELQIRWRWDMRLVEVHLSPTSMFGGIIKIAGADFRSNALGRLDASGFSMTGGLQIPLIGLKKAAKISADSAGFRAELTSSSIFSLFTLDFSAQVSRARFYMKGTSSRSMSGIARVVSSAKNVAVKSISAVSDTTLKVADYVSKIEAMNKWDVNTLCSQLGIGGSVAGMSKCDALKRIHVGNVRNVVAKIHSSRCSKSSTGIQKGYSCDVVCTRNTSQRCTIGSENSERRNHLVQLQILFWIPRLFAWNGAECAPFHDLPR